VHTDRLPPVTLLIAAFNEEDVIAAKIENSFALDYPRALLEILVVADGSSDGTCDVVRRYADRGVRLEYRPERRGKIHAVNRTAPVATGEVLVFSDANSMFAVDSLRKLVRNFGDPRVALVAGEKRVAADDGTVSKGEGLYWRYESLLKRLDSRVSSAMGAAGEIFAIRKEIFVAHAPAPDSIIEDFILSMGLVRDGHRVVYEPEAISLEEASPNAAEEFKRKVRIVAGGWQAVVRLWPLLSPTYGVIAFQYISHRVLRWVVVPFLLPAILLANLALLGRPLYQALMAAQVGFYALAFLGWQLERSGKKWGPAYLPFFFSFLNYAALCGAWRYFKGSQSVTWDKVKRPVRVG
ncbi:MAG: glycosyl transferase family 2, partial [Cyanobacteria bacterium RYN_339]|nr:glycosyl transferase family 2 [Cyanobacteria bacterium RYN_339]